MIGENTPKWVQNMTHNEIIEPKNNPGDSPFQQKTEIKNGPIVATRILTAP
jgi:hypothetical protein